VKIPDVSVAVYLPKCTEPILVPELANDVIDDGVDGSLAASSGPTLTHVSPVCSVPAGSGGLPGLRVLSRVSPSTPSAMKRACQRHTTGLALPDRRMISDVPQPSAVARDDFGAPDMLLRRVAIGHNRFKPRTVARRDLDHNSCSHNESLNCFGRFGNRPNESDH
jgi:hypothetical protein